VHKGFWWGDLREGDHLQDLGIAWRIILKSNFKKWEGEAQTLLLWFWLKTGTGGRHL